MWKSIKSFFSSLAFWKKKSPQIEPPKQEAPQQVTKEPTQVSDDGVGGEIQKPVVDLPLNDTIPMHYRFAYKEIGTKEVRGRNHNPRVLEYHDTTGNFSDDETAWCASFVNWCLIQEFFNPESGKYEVGSFHYNANHAGMNKLAKMVGTGKANARSFCSSEFTNMKHVTIVPLEEARVGDIVVYWRGSKNGWMGHVGFYAGIVGDNIKTLGGNQANEVNIRNYPKSRLLAVVRVDVQAIA